MLRLVSPLSACEDLAYRSSLNVALEYFLSNIRFVPLLISEPISLCTVCHFGFGIFGVSRTLSGALEYFPSNIRFVLFLISEL